MSSYGAKAPGHRLAGAALEVDCRTTFGPTSPSKSRKGYERTSWEDIKHWVRGNG